MISWKDLYTVLTAVMPLYVAMILAYASVRWWKIFSPEQCAGINRFVAVFAVPLLSFHFISGNDIYAMNFRFVAADTIQKLIVLIILFLWANFARNGSLDWAITTFSLSTLPNTLVMGIPLLIAMYGGTSGGPDPKSLMVQVVVLQSIIWYTLLLFLFEFRAAKRLITEQFPETAASIVSFKVDPDVVSLDGCQRGFLETGAEIRGDGKLCVTVRKSTSSRRSNLSGVEIYSMSPTPRGSNFNDSDFDSMIGRPSNFGPADVYSVPSTSNYDETNWAPNLELASVVGKKSSIHDAKELHMFVWSACESLASESGGLHVLGRQSEQFRRSEEGVKEIRMLVADHNEPRNGKSEGMVVKEEENDEQRDCYSGKEMPAASVMSRLTLMMVWRKLIRNPNTYSSLSGLIWSLVAFRWNVGMPQIMEESIAILSDAALGMAMFSLGT